jgi:MPBQ/MSBQ methyltransferase
MPMPNNADLSLTPEELSLLEAHLREQYRGVFDEQMVELHINEFVESRLADNLAAVITGGSRPGDALLDIGAGYGAFVLSCRRHGLGAIGFELESFEVDMSRRRLARAEPAADAAAVFRKGDAGRLPFEDNAFQVVTLLNVLEHVPDYRMVLAEAARVLRPGGRLFVVCPNYAALRKEAHYHIPWLPFFPRRLASAYLRLLGRNPGFFERHIYYCTNWGVLAALRDLGLQPSNLDVLRLEHPELIGSARARRILNVIHRAHMLPLLKLALGLTLHNPFKAAVTVVAGKKRPR